METPPRAWGKQFLNTMTLSCVRNTPTGVGKTARRCGVSVVIGKHPHGRGENLRMFCEYVKEKETPPRAWGKHPLKRDYFKGFRNTPTGVGKTQDIASHTTAVRKHPHGRGENFPFLFEPPFLIETPPRAWGKHCLETINAYRRRNTPTGVGKTYTHYCIFCTM